MSRNNPLSATEAAKLLATYPTCIICRRPVVAGQKDSRGPCHISCRTTKEGEMQ